uniref:Putative isopenicillin-n-synthase n=1 Tax=Ctenophora sp. C WRF-2014 TaxID=1567049 RepID=A0A0A0RZL3_9METZ|nr:putative isopenicillin-n-synthase [Ctenophora sp. C WRF-2014]
MVVPPAPDSDCPQCNPLDNVPKFKYNDIVGGTLKDKIVKAMAEYGFFYIIDIPGFEPQAEYQMMKSFFELPQNTKENYASIKHNPENSNVLRGYGLTRNTDGNPIEEVYNVGQYENRNISESDVSCKAEYISREPNRWPVHGDFARSEEFKAIVQNGFQLRIGLARLLVKEIGASLGYTDFLDKFTEAEFTSFYLKKYVARDSSNNNRIYGKNSGYSMVAEDGRDLSIPSHVDTTITLLATYSNGGLQALYNDVWYDVPGLQNSLMLMSGSLIEELTDGRLRSLRHRVIDIKAERYSTPFFFNPSFHADMSTSVSGKETSTGKESKTFGPWQVTQLHRDEPLLLHDTSLV